MNTSLKEDRFSRLSPPVEECMTAIMRMIRDGELSPSERVGEASLASALGVGLAAVRTALNRLALVGVIDRIPRSGSFVRKFSIQDFSQVMDVRCALESLSIRLATQSATAAELDALRRTGTLADDESVNPCLKTTESVIRTFQSDRDFHLRLAHLSRNTWLLPILENQHLLERCFLMANQLELDLTVQHTQQIPTHLDIVEAMQTREVRKAEEAMRKHILMNKEIRVRSLLGDFV